MVPQCMRNKDASYTLDWKIGLFFQLDICYISLFPSLPYSFAHLKLMVASMCLEHKGFPCFASPQSAHFIAGAS